MGPDMTVFCVIHAGPITVCTLPYFSRMLVRVINSVNNVMVRTTRLDQVKLDQSDLSKVHSQILNTRRCPSDCGVIRQKLDFVEFYVF